MNESKKRAGLLSRIILALGFIVVALTGCATCGAYPDQSADHHWQHQMMREPGGPRRG